VPTVNTAQLNRIRHITATLSARYDGLLAFRIAERFDNGDLLLAASSLDTDAHWSALNRNLWLLIGPRGGARRMGGTIRL
jgi:hypothetical protein